MRKFIAIAALLSFAAAASASAMSLPPAPVAESGVINAADGCGWAGHRNPWGVCVPNGRPYYGYRVCPPYMHLGPYGRACWPN